MVKGNFKKVFSGFTAFAIIFSMMSTTVLAVWDGGNSTLTLENGKAYLGADDKTEKAADEGLVYSDGVWNMNNFEFTTSAQVALLIKDSDSKLHLSGKDNKIESTYNGSSYSFGLNVGEYGNSDLEIDGNGNLVVKSGASSAAVTTGIRVNKLTINGGTVEAIGDNGHISYGINATDLVVTDGAVIATSENGNYNSNGIYSSNLTVNGGYIEAKGKTQDIYIRTNVTIKEGLPVVDEEGEPITSSNWKEVFESYKNIKIGTLPTPESDSPEFPMKPSNPESTVTPSTNGATIGGTSGNANDVIVDIANELATVSTISKDLIEEIASQEINGNAIVLDLSKAEGSNVSKVTLTKETIANIADVLSSADNNKESLVVKTNTATVTINSTALAAVVNQANAESIQIVVENKAEANLNDSQQATVNEIMKDETKEVVQTFEAYIISGGTKISDLNGGEISIGKVDFNLPDGRDPKKYQVYAISENGELVTLETWVEDGFIFFNTDSLSDYVLVYDESL